MAKKKVTRSDFSECRAVVEIKNNHEVKQKVTIDRFDLEMPKGKHSYGVIRQKIRLALLMHLDEFRWELEWFCDDFFGYGRRAKSLRQQEKKFSEFSNDWQVNLSFMPKVGVTLDKFLNDLSSKGRDRKKYFHKNISVWISDLKNPIPKYCAWDDLKAEHNFDSDNYFLLKIPRIANKDEIKKLVDILPIIEEPRGYLTTEMDIAVKVLSLRRSAEKSFRDIALELHKGLNGDALKAKEETYRKLYRKIVSEIIDLPTRLKRK